MRIDYDEQNVFDALRAFYLATGVAVQLLDENFQPLCRQAGAHTPYCAAIQAQKGGKTACGRSDAAILQKAKQTKQPQTHVCHAGLIDVAVPLLHGTDILGFLILGQMKRTADFSAAKDCLLAAMDEAQLAQMQLTYQNLTLFNEEKIQSVAKIAVMLAKHLLLDRLLTPTPEHHAERASAFIEQNLSSPLSIQRISRGVGTSKSVLYKAFHTAYGCTIGEFVNQKRVEKAAELLNSTALSLDEVALQVGYSSAAYFSRTFKRIKGVSPLRFKKQHA